jgi:hypothetical protein
MSNSPDKANSSRRYSESDSFIVEHSPMSPNKRKVNIFSNMVSYILLYIAI